jgi:hypothetical protein
MPELYVFFEITAWGFTLRPALHSSIAVFYKLKLRWLDYSKTGKEFALVAYKLQCS